MNKVQVFDGHEAVNPICAGIDVHRDKVNVTIARTEGNRIRYYYDVFYTVKSDLERMLLWLQSYGCTVVGMESTGKYWRPVLNVLESHLKIYLYNARHIKNIPGKKTDKKDSQWIAKITRYELIGHSFIPDALTRGTRDLVRSRKARVQSKTRVRQQIHDILTATGIRIALYISDIFGVSGRFLLDCIANNRPITKAILSSKMNYPINQKVDLIYEALDGTIRDENRYMLRMLLQEENRIRNDIDEIEFTLEKMVICTPEREELLERLIDIPGFGKRSAILLLGEIGTDLSSFPDAKHFSSWCGLAPGKKESAGKNLSGRVRVRQHYLRSLLIEVAFASIRCKNTYYNNKYLHLRRHKSVQKSIIAIARKLSIAVYIIITKGERFEELTPEYVPLEEMARDLKNLQRLAKKIGKDPTFAYLDQVFESSG